MDTTLFLTFNSFFLAAIMLAVPVLLIAGIWTAAENLRRPVPAAVELQAAPRSAHQH